MRKKIKPIFFLLLFSMNAITSRAQEKNSKYFLIDFNSIDYKVNAVTLSAKELYGFDEKFELFNVISKNTLILFTVMPTHKPWVEVDINKLQGEEMRIGSLDSLFKNVSNQNLSNKNVTLLKRNDIKVILHKNGKYIMSDYCLTEYFIITNTPLMFPNQSASCFINITTPKFSADQFERDYRKFYKTYSANAIESKRWSGTTFLFQPFYDKPLLFLSSTTKVDNKEAFKFWTYLDWRVADGPNVQRGIDRFLYIPLIGIVGGSYDFWFNEEKKSISYDKLMKNYLAEKVMYPIEINGEPVK